MSSETLIANIVGYFRSDIFEPHLNKLEGEYAALSSYSPNPFVTPYLSKLIDNEYNAYGSASALYLSRVLTTSINTAFGSHIRKILVANSLAISINSRSNIISFTDRTTNAHTVCLLKSGPNTINSGDKVGIRNKLEAYNTFDNKAIGIIYGSVADINAHYVALQSRFELFVGADFWHRITGHPNFYNDLTRELRHLIEEFDTHGRVQSGLNSLTNRIVNSQFLDQ